MQKKQITHTKLHEDIKANGTWQIRIHKTISPNVYEHLVALSGQRWESMEKRCIDGGDQQIKYPRYAGTTNMFGNFNDFVEWSRAEVGYDLRESIGNQSWAWCIEKDILGNGSKVYSPETCLFVPNAVNIFLTARNAARIDYVLHAAGAERLELPAAI